MTLRTSTGRFRAALLVLCAALILGVLGAPASATRRAPTQETPTTTAPDTHAEEGTGDLKEEYDEVIGQEAALLRELDEAQASRMKATAELEALNKKTQDTQLQLLTAQQELDAAEKVVEERIAARKAAEQKVRTAKERLRKQIVASYVTGGESGGTIEAFLQAQNGDEVGQALAYGRAASGSTETLLAELEEAQDARAAAAKAARSAKQQALAARDDIQDAATFLVAARQQQQDLLADLNIQVYTEAVALREVQGHKAIVEGRINSMNRASDGVAMILATLQADQPDWVPGSVEATNPIPGLKPGSAFGMRRHPILGIDRLHAGADMGAPSGTEIYAPADGFVVLAEVRGGFGNAVVIDHGNSLGTLYAHTSKILVKPGQVVQRGEVIALVGSTGLSTGPHLHFETRIKGMPIDPAGVIDFDEKVVYPVRDDD